MHTLEVDGGYFINFNGDFSGDVKITRPDETSVWVPFHVLAAIVTEKIRGDRISALEDMSTNDLLT